MIEVAEVEYRPVAPFARWVSDVVDEPDLELLDRAVESMRATQALAGPTDVELSTRRSLLLAALHTGAVEGVHRMNRGVTLTALDGALDWKRVVEDAEGTDARRHVEAALAAYDLAVDAARADATPISEAWIRRVHEVACAAQATVMVRTAIGQQEQVFVKGRYKTEPNHVLLPDGRIHHYAPPSDVPSEMHRLVAELRRPEVNAAQPVLQAAYVHHALTQIHPFQDGNGRVARVLASVPLMRWASVPFHLYEDQVAEYFDALAEADAGAPGQFVAFVYDRVLDLVQLTEDRVAAELPVSDLQPDQRRARAVAATERVERTVLQLLNSIVETNEWPDDVEAQVWEAIAPIGEADAANRRLLVNKQPHLLVRLATGEQMARDFPIFVAIDGDQSTLAIGRSPDRTLELGLDEIRPEIRTAAVERIDAYLRRSVRDTLDSLLRSVAEMRRAR